MVEMDADAGADAIVWLVVFHLSYSLLDILQIQFKVLLIHLADIDTDPNPSGRNSTIP